MSLSDTTDFTTKYAEQVVEKQIPACRYVTLACRRHLADLQRQWEYHFDVNEANKFFKFCSYLKHYK